MDALSKFSSYGSQKLRNLITHFRAHTTTLKVAFQENAEADVLSQFAIHEFLLKADNGTRLDWERELQRRKTFATFDEFIVNMEEQCNAYERTIGNTSSTQGKSESNKFNKSKGQAFAAKCSTSTSYCSYCNEMSHPTFKWGKFLALTPEERNQNI